MARGTVARSCNEGVFVPLVMLLREEGGCHECVSDNMKTIQLMITRHARIGIGVCNDSIGVVYARILHSTDVVRN